MAFSPAVVAVMSRLGPQAAAGAQRRAPRRERIVAALLALALLAPACSPEATRRRDGGPGADIGNSDRIAAPAADARPADTTMMPGRASAPVERLARGTMPAPGDTLVRR
ncbi:MAG: hypothetical protein ACT4R6_14585 [Gemmatimonadaceae bacterium]